MSYTQYIKQAQNKMHSFSLFGISFVFFMLLVVNSEGSEHKAMLWQNNIVVSIKIIFLNAYL